MGWNFSSEKLAEAMKLQSCLADSQLLENDGTCFALIPSWIMDLSQESVQEAHIPKMIALTEKEWEELIGDQRNFSYKQEFLELDQLLEARHQVEPESGIVAKAMRNMTASQVRPNAIVRACEALGRAKQLALKTGKPLVWAYNTWYAEGHEANYRQGWPGEVFRDAKLIAELDRDTLLAHVAAD